ncbi:MAG: OmpA family protein [Alphaproteobacteria bacterium]
MAGRSAQSEESTEHFFTAFTDLLVGVIFIFILLLMVFALNFKQAEAISQQSAQKVVVTEEVRAALLKAIASDMQLQGTPVTLDLGSGIIRLPESLLFASGEWQLSERGKQVIGQLAGVLGKYLPCASGQRNDCTGLAQGALLDSVLIEGHTDKRPFSNAQGMTNWELSAFRAISVYKALTAAQPALDSGILNREGQPLLGVSAYAERRPVSYTELDPNRRIDLRFNMRGPSYADIITVTPNGQLSHDLAK